MVCKEFEIVVNFNNSPIANSSLNFIKEVTY